MILSVGSLFSGIGGIELGLEQTGHFRTIWQCECEPYARSVLRRRWPDVPCYDRVEDIAITHTPPCPDLLCGGFPCQPVSNAGRRGKQTDSRWLWPEFRRIVRALRPAWVLGENVVGLVSAGLDDILADLEAEGYAAWPFTMEAGVLGAEHHRERVFVVAHHPGIRVEGIGAAGVEVSQAHGGSFLPLRGRDGQWQVEPDIRRVPDGVPSAIHRLRCLGNAVCPPMSYQIGLFIYSQVELQGVQPCQNR